MLGLAADMEKLAAMPEEFSYVPADLEAGLTVRAETTLAEACTAEADGEDSDDQVLTLTPAKARGLSYGLMA